MNEVLALGRSGQVAVHDQPMPKRTLRPVGGWSTLVLLELSGSCCLLMALILMMVFGLALFLTHFPSIANVVGLVTVVVGLWLWRVVLSFVISRFPAPPSDDGG